MAWKKNPRVITKEQFSEGTTIDGDRIDNAMSDVVERVNNVPYGDLRKRWVPITYVAGWTPQAPATLEASGPDVTKSAAGEIIATHHWPWLPVKNSSAGVVTGTLGADPANDGNLITNPHRLKGVSVPGIFPYGKAEATASTYTEASASIGAQFAWARSWFLERPSILNRIDLILELDHASAGADDLIYNNTFKYADSSVGGRPPGGKMNGSDDQGLVITATVDNEFAREDRNMADIEVLRKHFNINQDKFSALPLSEDSVTAPTYSDFSPEISLTAKPIGASTIQGVHIKLGAPHGLNIPIHQNARLRVSVAIPNYADGTGTLPDNRPNGWNPDNDSANYPWLQQKIHMVVTMLEEVTSG